MLKEKDRHRYDDMLHLPHHTSERHPRMSLTDRAAQFSPFAALTGYDAAVKEAARFTERRIELDEDIMDKLNEKLQFLQENLDSEPELAITYFQPDERKAGGAYAAVSGCVKRMNAYEQTIIMKDGTRIPIGQIKEIEFL